MADIDLILVDPNERVCDAWAQTFAPFPEVSIVCGRFETLAEFDCVVSAANSFGLIDGGVDLAMARPDRLRESFLVAARTSRARRHSFASAVGFEQVTTIIKETTMSAERPGPR